MHTKLFFIRKIKALFIKFKLHKIFIPLDGLLSNLIYLTRLSLWVNKNKILPFNDFYNNKVEYNDRFKLHEFVINTEIKNESFDYLEFGVAEGVAFKWWVKKIINPECKFYGFDVFTGLPEDFGVMKKHHYDTKGSFPDIQDNRVEFISGLFQNSLPTFLRSYSSNKRKVIHMDADLYSSTLYVLTRLFPTLKKDDIVIFDEFGVPTHEFKAFSEIVHSYNLKYSVIGAVNNYLQLAIKIN